MDRKATSSGIEAIRAQLRSEIDRVEEKIKKARSRAHIDGAAYAAGEKAAYEHALAILHT